MSAPEDKQHPAISAEVPTLISRRCSEITTTPITWLWRNHLATKLVVCAGEPGCGKSQLTINFAATVSQGGQWPDGSTAPQGSVVFINAEDDAGDTVVPRLKAAGANLDKVHVVDCATDGETQTTFSIAENVDQLAELTAKIGDVKLVVIDPVTAFSGGKVDTHKTGDVRAMLAPLQALADKHKLCVLLVSHLNKNSGGEAMTRITGSGAYVAAARAAYLIGKDPNDDTLRCFVPLKNNLGDDSTGFTYKIEPKQLPGGIETSAIKWEGGSVTMKASELLAPPKPPEEETSAKGDACRFLIDLLREGPVPSRDVFEKAEAAAISERTVKRAKKDIGVRSIKVDGLKQWHYELPPRTVPVEGGHPPHPWHCGTLGTLKGENSNILPEEGQECQECQEGHDVNGREAGTLDAEAF